MEGANGAWGEREVERVLREEEPEAEAEAEPLVGLEW